MPLFGRSRPAGNEIEEMQVVAAILAACPDPRSRLLFEQFARARKRTRTETADGFSVGLGGNPDRDLRVDLDEDVTTTWIPVHDSLSKEAIEFRLVLRQGGVFGALEARAPGGTWPDPWRVDSVELAQAARGVLTLPGGDSGD